ncbi:nucleotidyltransferase family protein [Nonomuraea cypriaca]|uniref:nucleotidyltransferase family protein n=1 Tax=Nonomuraea cypriaca TaxID=1187855 RepID=UPI0038B3FB29
MSTEIPCSASSAGICFDIQAVILNGGRGTRMRPYTENRPKGLVEVAGKSIFHWQAGWLAHYGVRDIVVSAGYHGEMLEVAATEVMSELPDLKINVVRETTPLGRGGGLKHAAKALPFDEPWFGINGDVITDMNLSELAEQRNRSGTIGTLTLARYHSHLGVVEVDEVQGRVRGFTQSPQLPYWINAGIYCFRPDFMMELPDSGDHEDSTFPRLAHEGALGAFPLKGYWRGVDTVKDVLGAGEDIHLGRVTVPAP